MYTLVYLQRQVLSHTDAFSSGVMSLCWFTDSLQAEVEQLTLQSLQKHVTNLENNSHTRNQRDLLYTLVRESILLLNNIKATSKNKDHCQNLCIKRNTRT